MKNSNVKVKQLSLLDPLRTRSQLYDYQKKAASLIIKQHTIALFMKPGMGKTAATLYALERIAPKRTLIVAPIRVCETVWAQEAREWKELQHLTFKLIRGTPVKRIAQLQASTDFHLINYDLLHWLNTVVDISSHYDAIVFDELSMMKSPGSRRFKAIKKHLDKIPIRVGLTGTPTGNSLLGVWSQIHCVAGSRNPLGTSHYWFKKQYFHRGGYMDREYLPHKHTHNNIMGDINGMAYSFELKKEYCPIQFTPIKVEMPENVQPLYRKFAKEYLLYLENGGEIWAPTGGAMVNKLRQFESGSVYSSEGVEHYHTVKRDALIDLVTELNGDPLIIFYEYLFEKEMLFDCFSDSLAVDVEDWNTGNVPVMSLHPKSAGHGLNLQKGGCNVLFYTAPWSLELWQQSIGRVYRTGQKRSVTVYHFEGMPVENRVIKSLKKNEEIELKTFKGLAV